MSAEIAAAAARQHGHCGVAGKSHASGTTIRWVDFTSSITK